jgi:hypothetical protein
MRGLKGDRAWASSVVLSAAFCCSKLNFPYRHLDAAGWRDIEILLGRRLKRLDELLAGLCVLVDVVGFSHGL